MGGLFINGRLPLMNGSYWRMGGTRSRTSKMERAAERQTTPFGKYMSPKGWVRDKRQEKIKATP